MHNESTWMVKGPVLTDYLQACKEAATTDLFATFKRDPRLTAIFEHTTADQGRFYLALVLRQTPWLLEANITNDAAGAATIFGFERKYFYSPSTLQYLGVLSNLLHLFGSMDGLRICEIGGGYGGQCRTILDCCRPECYHIIDLKEVCELQRHYLHNTIAECFTEPTGQDYDLVISNYALSEIKYNKPYIDGVLSRSKHGYITCNTDFVSLPFAHKRLPDITGEANNHILTW